MSKRRYPLLRAVAELVNAANGVQPIAREGYLTIPVFAFGWPTSEMSPVYMARLDARRAAPRPARRLPRCAGPNRVGAHGNRLGAAVADPPPQRGVANRTSKSRCARRSATTTSRSPPSRSRRGAVAPGSACGPTDLVRRRYVEKTSTVQYGPHRRVNRADIWRRADLPRDGKAPVLLQVPGGAWAIGMRRPQSYALLSHMAERGWVCVSIDYRVSPKQHLAGPHRRRQACAGVDQGEHRRLRR